MLEDGWRVIDAAFRASLKTKNDKYGADESDENGDSLPELQEGQIFTAVTVTIREGKTKPPARFTEGTLLRAMETAGAK